MESNIKESDVKLLDRVAYGASGEVYQATWKSSKHGQKLEVAAKKIPLRSDATPAEQMKLEVDILQGLDHENVVKYYGHVVTQKYLMIITEFAAKGSLKDYLKTKMRLTRELANKWAIEAAQGIQYLQNVGIVHRDIKSANFLITADNTLKVCDFGIAKLQDSTKTTQHTDRGTLPWLAPEVFMEGKLSPKADVYSFGIVLWELHSCELPYRGMIPQHVMFKVATEKIRPEIPEDCPPEIRQLIEECWAQDRGLRPQIDEVVERLKRFGR